MLLHLSDARPRPLVSNTRRWQETAASEASEPSVQLSASLGPTSVVHYGSPEVLPVDVEE